jgi:hypothetical protein
MAAKKKKPSKKRTASQNRQSFRLPSDGMLHDSMEDIAMYSDLDTLPDGVAPVGTTRGELSGEQLATLRSMIDYDNLAKRALMTILGSMLFFSVGTSVAGALLGLCYPKYLAYLAGATNRLDFQPLMVGLGHGLIAGTILGVLVGGFTVVSVALYQSRTIKNISKPN